MSVKTPNLLSELSDWPIDNISATLITPGGTETYGDQERVYELASVTKLLSAYAFLIAIEEGVFDLDSKCAGHEVRQLLAHASGVGFHKEDKQKPPLQRRIYSSYGYEILAAEIERQCEMSFAEYLDEAVFQPLAMRNSELYGSAGHGARSTAADLSRFAHEILEPKLLAPETLQEAQEIHYPELNGIVPGYGMQKPCPWGYGFEIKGAKSPHWTGSTLPPETIGHFGVAGTYLWLVPERHTAMVFLGDRDFGDWVKPLWHELNTEIGKHLPPNGG